MLNWKVNTNSQIKFKILVLNSSLCDHSDANILVSRSIIVSNTGTAAAPNNKKYVIIIWIKITAFFKGHISIVL